MNENMIELKEQNIVENAISERIPKIGKHRVVIIGGGFAGIEVVRELKKCDVQIVMIDKHNYHTFIPLLYQVATAGLSPGDISSPLREFLNEGKHFHFRLAKVKNVDAITKTVRTNIGDLQYDSLVIATGSSTNFYGNDQLEKNAHKLREISDAIALRTQLIDNFEEALKVNNQHDLDKHMNIIIAGGGPTGVELAGAIGELRKHVLPADYPELDFRQMQIYLIEGHHRLLAAMSEKSGKRARKYLENKFEVNVITKTKVSSYENGLAILSDGTQIRTNCVIWAAGVKGNVLNGVAKDNLYKGRILVDEFNNVGSMDGVYAIGDVAAMKTKEFPDGLPMLAPVAIQQASHLASNIKRKLKGESLKPFKYTDKGTMATIGRNKAVVDAPFGIKLGGFIGWFIWMFIHLFSIIGIRRKLLVFSNWVWNYLTFNRGNRLIIRKEIE